MHRVHIQELPVHPAGPGIGLVREIAVFDSQVSSRLMLQDPFRGRCFGEAQGGFDLQVHQIPGKIPLLIASGPPLRETQGSLPSRCRPFHADLQMTRSYGVGPYGIVDGWHRR